MASAHSVTPSRSRVVALAAALITMATTSALGYWQLRRAEAKLQAQGMLTERQNLPAWTSSDWSCGAHAVTDLPVQRRVQLEGTWLHARTIWLDNRTQSGRTGFEVVTPLRLHAPGSACDGRLLLIQRGWVPRHAQDRTRLPDIPAVSGVVTIQGRVAASLSRVYQIGDEGLPDATHGSVPSLIRQNAGTDFWRAWLGQYPLPGAVLQTHAESGEPVSPLRRDWAAPDLGRDKHLAYAAQWFALSLLAAGLTIWFQWVRPQSSAKHIDHPDQHAAS